MIVLTGCKLVVGFGRVDEDGDVVNPTALEWPLEKLHDDVWDRVRAQVRAKLAELQAFHGTSYVPVLEDVPEEPQADNCVVLEFDEGLDNRLDAYDAALEDEFGGDASSNPRHALE